MRPECACPLLFFVATASFTVMADATLVSLHKNPFSRPESVRPKPSPPPAPVAVALERVRLDLTATLVSEVAPMVIVNGELLGIGDEIDGLKLVAVREGRAVFSRGGEKITFAIETGELE